MFKICFVNYILYIVEGQWHQSESYSYDRTKYFLNSASAKDTCNDKIKALRIYFHLSNNNKNNNNNNLWLQLSILIEIDGLL